MDQITVSDREEHCRYIAYIAGALAAKRENNARICFDGGRVYFIVETTSPVPTRKVAEDRIADVLCVGYKYAYLRANVCPAGLSAEDREILVAAIIAADFAEEKRYVLAKLANMQSHTIDGFYDFRLKELREKWESVAACVPPVFTKGQLTEFMQYLLHGGKGKIFLKGGEVYDSRCRKLRKSSLIGDESAEINVLREIVLSGAGKVECLGTPSCTQERFLRRFYDGRVFFG